MRKNNHQIYDELIQQPEFQSFIYAPNFYRPEQNSIWLSNVNLDLSNNNGGDLSCGGNMTRKRDLSVPLRVQDNFKICYSRALQNARGLSPSPVNTIRNNWS